MVRREGDPPDPWSMKTVALGALAVVLLSGCTGGEEPLSPAASASASCAELGDLFERSALRVADVSRLGEAQDAAQAAAEGEPRWEALASSLGRLHAAATKVAESVRQPTSGSEQRAINAEYTSAKGAAAEACADV